METLVGCFLISIICPGGSAGIWQQGWEHQGQVTPRTAQSRTETSEGQSPAEFSIWRGSQEALPSFPASIPPSLPPSLLPSLLPSLHPPLPSPHSSLPAPQGAGSRLRQGLGALGSRTEPSGLGVEANCISFLRAAFHSLPSASHSSTAPSCPECIPSPSF